VANWQLPQDFMFVMLEGVVILEPQLLPKVYIFEKKFFTISTLNSQSPYSEGDC